jgi:hypothetical protein
LIEVMEDDLVVITGTATFDYVEKLVAIGLLLDKVAAALARMASHHVASVQSLIASTATKSGSRSPTPARRVSSRTRSPTRPLNCGLWQSVSASRRSAGRSTMWWAQWPPRRPPSSFE